MQKEATEDAINERTLWAVDEKRYYYDSLRYSNLCVQKQLKDEH